MAKPKTTVVIITDDESKQHELLNILSPQYNVRAYMTAREFLLDTTAPQTGAILIAQRIRGLSPAEFTAELAKRQPANGMKVLILTGPADVPAVIALNPYDFVLTPIKTDVLTKQIDRAMTDSRYTAKELEDGFKRLTGRESSILTEICKGASSRDVAESMSISTKTVEAHRAKIMAKTRAADMAELVRMHREYSSLS
jgi:two-component system response regulator FixJ